MNKITSILAGIATVAAVSVAPAFAQGNLFSPPGTFTFAMPTATTFTATGSNDSYNPLTSSTTQVVGFTLTGTEVGSSNTYTLNSLIIGTTASNANLFTYNPTNNVVFFTFSNTPGTPTSIASLGADNTGTTFNLAAPAVPEASTTISFGALLALGGLALVLRRKGVKNAA